MAWVPDGYGGWRQDDPNDTSPPPLAPSSTGATLRPRTLPGLSAPQQQRSRAPAQASSLYGAPRETQLSPPPAAAAPSGRVIGYDYNGNPIYSGSGGGAVVDRTASEDAAAAAGNRPEHQPGNPNRKGFLGELADIAVDVGSAAFNPAGYVFEAAADAVGAPGLGDVGAFVANPIGEVGRRAVHGVGSAANEATFGKSSSSLTSPAGNTSSLDEATGVTPAPSFVDEQAPALEEAQTEAEENILENNEAAQATVDSVLDQWNEARRLDTTAADESRRLQEAVFARQTSIINRILDFDPEAYARMFGDQALGGLFSAARSARGGAGAVNAALFSAQQQAPQLFAEGARQAAQIENQRLGMAGDVAAQAGQVAGDVRAGDEERARFTADLGVRVMQGITELTGLDLQLDAQAQEQLAALGLDFARLYQQYAGMDHQTMLAQWDNLMRKYAIDEQTRVALEQIRAQVEAGKIGWDDVALTLMSTGGQVAAGYFAGRGR